jgi:CheY-like chemotaxis protein
MHAMDLTQILVVEDEMIVALDLTLRLTRWGHTVTRVPSVDAAAMLRPGLVFIDVHLPGANGWPTNGGIHLTAAAHTQHLFEQSR